MKPFRHHHLLSILRGFDESKMPLDLFLARYFRANKAVGSKDRRWICEHIYLMIRWKGLIDAQIPRPAMWENRLDALSNFRNQIDHLPPHVQVSFPKFLYQMLDANDDLCRVLNEPAPTMIRVNRIKITREKLLDQWDQPCYPTLHSPNGLVFKKKINFFATPEFKKGFFEIQDEASQLVAATVDAKPGDHVLDYCAGSGGKTLAIAPQMEEKGQIYLYDIREHALLEAKKRLKRAGVQNAQVTNEKGLKSLRGKMDWVLVDAPCSGTGTLRRNPDMKWKITPEMIERLVKEQRAIFESALQYLKPDGKIVYATCSILPAENEEQTVYFEKALQLQMAAPPFKTLPESGKIDGFFAATLIR